MGGTPEDPNEPGLCICPLQVIFEHEGVFIHPGSDEEGIEQDLIISGSLRIVDKVRLVFLFYGAFLVSRMSSFTS